MLCHAWIAYLEAEQTSAGGCLLISASTEFDGRPGPVRTAVLEASNRWYAALANEVRAAVQTGQLPDDADVDQLVFELNGVGLSTNQAIQLHQDPAAGQRARRALRRLILGPETAS
jgi:hypothetical protein